MRKGSKVIKIKYEEDSIFVGAAWGRKRTIWVPVNILLMVRLQ